MTGSLLSAQAAHTWPPLAAREGLGVEAAVGSGVPAGRRTRYIRATRGQPLDTLDEDLAAYFDRDAIHVARVEILGGVRVRASGPIERKRLPLCTELVVFLATHEKGGCGPAQLDLALWPDHVVQPSTRTEAIARARRWLAVDRSGQLNLPTGHGREFRLGPDVLLDWDLFRRLAERGMSAGPQGTGDLSTALRLVRGKPFEGVRSTRYQWVAETFLEQDIPTAVVDVAHQLARSRLDADDPVGVDFLALLQGENRIRDALGIAPVRPPRIGAIQVARLRADQGLSAGIVRIEVRVGGQL